MEPNNTTQTAVEPKGDKSIGPAIGIIIIILVMVVGSLYFLSERMKERRQPTPPAQNDSSMVVETSGTEVDAQASVPELVQ
mgnify:CR=1 FL=1